jgi:Short C-terminal domain
MAAVDHDYRVELERMADAIVPLMNQRNVGGLQTIYDRAEEIRADTRGRVRRKARDVGRMAKQALQDIGRWEADEKAAVDVTPLSLGIALVGAGVTLLAVFLPQFESSTFAPIEKNTLIQNGDGWWFILLAVLAAGAAYRAYRGQRRTFAPVVFGAIAILLAIYYGTSHSQRRLCSAISGGSDCTLGTPGIGTYAAGVGGLLIVIGGLQMFRAAELVYDDEEEDKGAEDGGPTAGGMAERLRTLEDLRQKGLLTEPEYNERRAKLLDGI